MPELPEVEIAMRHVARTARGARLLSIDVPDDRLVRTGEPLLASMADATVDDVWRRAKYGVMVVGDTGMVWHLRMTGKLITARDGVRARASMVFDNGTTLVFADTRRLGELHLVPAHELPAFFASRGLGPEPWPERFEGAWWRDRLGSARSPIKVALMDQARVAGLGNILASEALFEARIAPHTLPATLTDDAWASLAAAVPQVIDRVLAAEDGDEVRYVNDGGDVADTAFCVYAREGAPCMRCGHAIARTRHAGRSTFWCPTCQPDGK